MPHMSEAPSDIPSSSVDTQLQVRQANGPINARCLIRAAKKRVNEESVGCGNDQGWGGNKSMGATRPETTGWVTMGNTKIPMPVKRKKTMTQESVNEAYTPKKKRLKHATACGYATRWMEFHRVENPARAEMFSRKAARAALAAGLPVTNPSKTPNEQLAQAFQHGYARAHAKIKNTNPSERGPLDAREHVFGFVAESINQEHTMQITEILSQIAKGETTASEAAQVMADHLMERGLKPRALQRFVAWGKEGNERRTRRSLPGAQNAEYQKQNGPYLGESADEVVLDDTNETLSFIGYNADGETLLLDEDDAIITCDVDVETLTEAKDAEDTESDNEEDVMKAERKGGVSAPSAEDLMKNPSQKAFGHTDAKIKKGVHLFKDMVDHFAGSYHHAGKTVNGVKKDADYCYLDKERTMGFAHFKNNPEVTGIDPEKTGVKHILAFEKREHANHFYNSKVATGSTMALTHPHQTADGFWAVGVGAAKKGEVRDRIKAARDKAMPEMAKKYDERAKRFSSSNVSRHRAHSFMAAIDGKRANGHPISKESRETYAKYKAKFGNSYAALKKQKVKKIAAAQSAVSDSVEVDGADNHIDEKMTPANTENFSELQHHINKVLSLGHKSRAAEPHIKALNSLGVKTDELFARLSK